MTLALAWGLLGPSPSAAPASSEVHEPVEGRVSFDESIGASGSSPIVTGLEAAAEHKRRDDQDIPLQTQNPQLTVMPGARVNAGPDDGFELQATITQGWNLEGYGQSRRAAATAETELLAADARAAALERRFGAAQAWIMLHAAERRLAMASEDLALAESLVETLELARTAGVATRVDVAEARAIAAASEAVLVQLAGEVHDRGLALARETGTVVAAPLGTRGDYPSPSLPDEAELRRRFAAVDQLPAVQLRRVEARAALALAHEAKRARGAVLRTGASVQLESTRDVLIFAVVGASIPAIDRGQRQRASAHAEARRAEAEAEQLLVELSAVLGTVLHELRHTREQLELLRDRSLPALDELVAARTAALELGEGTRAQLLAAQHQRNLVTRELVLAEADWVLARVTAWLYLEALSAEPR